MQTAYLERFLVLDGNLLFETAINRKYSEVMQHHHAHASAEPHASSQGDAEDNG